ncbi:unnamed protein product [Sphagnum compactum]
MDSDQGKLFIGGISWETTEEKLRDHFQAYGVVAEVVIMKDRATGRARGFGFVVFADPAVADRVVKEKHTIDGRTVEAKKAVPRDEKQNVPRSSNGGQVPASSHPRTKKIFVGGLASSVTEDDFRQYFAQFGTITDVVVMYDHNTQRPRGFGFVSFDSEEAVENVLMKSFHELNEKMVEVKRATPKDLSAGSGRGASGFGGGMGGGNYNSGYGQGYASPGGGGGGAYGGRGDGRYGQTVGAGRGGYGGYGAAGYGAAGYGAGMNGGYAGTGYGMGAGYGSSAGAGYGSPGYGSTPGGGGTGAAPATGSTAGYGGTGYGYGSSESGYGSAAGYGGRGSGYGTGVAVSGSGGYSMGAGAAADVAANGTAGYGGGYGAAGRQTQRGPDARFRPYPAAGDRTG